MLQHRYRKHSRMLTVPPSLLLGRQRAKAPAQFQKYTRPAYMGKQQGEQRGGVLSIGLHEATTAFAAEPVCNSVTAQTVQRPATIMNHAKATLGATVAAVVFDTTCPESQEAR